MSTTHATPHYLSHYLAPCLSAPAGKTNYTSFASGELKTHEHNLAIGIARIVDRVRLPIPWHRRHSIQRVPPLNAYVSLRCVDIDVLTPARVRANELLEIVKEAQELSTSPSPDYHAAPLETNLFEWHFTLRGPPAPSPFADGLYHGRIVLPPTYPLRPPSFRFLTPSGRFEVNREICLSISGHHEESWQPAWGLRTALVALRSFMETEAKGQVGGIEATKEVRSRLARESTTYRCVGCGGRSNEEVIRAVEEASKQSEGSAERKEEVVPEELRLGYRDELGDKGKGPADEASNATAAEESISGTNGGGSRIGEESSPVLVARTPMPQVAVATPTTFSPNMGGVTTLPRPGSSHRPTQPLVSAPQDRIQQSPLPPWVDKAIVGIALGLAFMLLRKFLAFTS